MRLDCRTLGQQSASPAQLVAAGLLHPPPKQRRVQDVLEYVNSYVRVVSVTRPYVGELITKDYPGVGYLVLY